MKRRALFLVLCLVATQLQAAAPDFSDEIWTSLGGAPGTAGPANAVVQDSNQACLFIGGKFGGAGITLATNIVGWNGTNFFALGPGLNGQVLALALGNGGQLFAGGTFTNSGGLAVSNVAVWDGATWSAVGSGCNGTVSALAVDSTGNLYAGGSFTVAGGVSASRIAKWDGTAWSSLGAGVDGSVNAIECEPGGIVYAAGTFLHAGGAAASFIARWNGSSWSPLGSGLNSAGYALLLDGSGSLLVGGSFNSAGGVAAKLIARWDGASWAPVGTGTTEGTRVSCLTADVSGNIYAGGNFLKLGGVSTSGIARWDGSSWSNLGSGLGQSATTVNGVSFGPRGELFAVGSFVSTYFAPSDGIAKFDGVQWSAVQNLPPRLGRVRSITAGPDGIIYAAYDTGCAKWTGSNWFSFASPVIKTPGTPTVWSLAADKNNNVWAGGVFGSIGGTAAVNLARWDGTNWSATGFDGGSTGGNWVNTLFCGNDSKLYVGCSGGIRILDGTNWSNPGLLGDVWSLGLDSLGRLYAGGLVTIDNWQTGDHLARWDGTNWIGLNVNDYVWSLVANKSGSMYAGGAFNTVGGMPSPGVAKYNGIAWEPISSCPVPRVFVITLDDYGNLYAGGGFRSAGVGLWDGANWHALGSGIDNVVYALHFDRSQNLYAGGIFGRAGTNYSTNIARAAIPSMLGRLGLSLNQNGTLEMRLPGPATQACVLEESSDFVNWLPMATNISSPEGLWTFTNSCSGFKNFFRAVLP